MQVCPKPIYKVTFQSLVILETSVFSVLQIVNSDGEDFLSEGQEQVTNVVLNSSGIKTRWRKCGKLRLLYG